MVHAFIEGEPIASGAEKVKGENCGWKTKVVFYIDCCRFCNVNIVKEDIGVKEADIMYNNCG